MSAARTNSERQVANGAAAGLYAFTSTVQGHEVSELQWATLGSAWSDQLWLWLLLAATLALYLRGIVNLWRKADRKVGIHRWRVLTFMLGWLALVVAVLSPLDAMGNALFWAHMVQHEVLLLIAAPALVLGRPVAAMVWGLPVSWRRPAATAAARSGLKALSGLLTRPMTAWWVHAGALWIWHAPVLFEAALAVQWIHDTQHISFFVSALVFWWSLFHGPGARPRYDIALLYVFTTAVHTSVLGALLTFSDRVLYQSYLQSAPAWGLTALEDQQLGGLIMWVPGGLVYLGIGLVLFAAWLRDFDRRETARSI